MFSWERFHLAKCQASTIVEDLGQIHYIFSDKTGTLTRNEMEFRHMLIGTEFYGELEIFDKNCRDEFRNEEDVFEEFRQSVIDEVDQPLPEVWNCPKFFGIMNPNGP